MKLRSRPRSEVKKDGRLGGGKALEEMVYNKDEREKLVGTARNLRLLHIPVEWLNK